MTQPAFDKEAGAGGSAADAAAAGENVSPETTAESATLGPPEEENQVVATGAEPDSVLPGPDAPAQIISMAPADPGGRAGGVDTE